MNTYFIIDIFFDKDIQNIYYQFGPYIKYDEAICVFMDLEYIIHFFFPEMETFSASIGEYIVQENALALVNTLITETGRKNVYSSRHKVNS